MATDLTIFGPIKIPFQDNGKGSAKHIGKNEIKEFWESKEANAVAEKQGVYVFGSSA